MAQIRPFRAFYYNLKKVKLENVITQPYDKIDAKLQQTYYQRDPYNGVRLILSPETPVTDETANAYQDQANLLDEWCRQEIFLQDDSVSLYPYMQEFSIYGQRRKRQAFVAQGLLEDYKNQVVFPHEETLSKPKADRIAHLKATQTQFGLIFMLYEDPQFEITALMNQGISMTDPHFDTTDFDYGVRHKMWRLKEQEINQEIVRLMSTKRLLIADGHHRYETALNHQTMMRRGLKGPRGIYPFDYFMAAFINLYDEGLVILPTHRLVRNISDTMMMNLTDRLRKDFKIERVSLPAENRSIVIHQKMDQLNTDQHVIGLYDGGHEFVLLHYLSKCLPKEKLSQPMSDAWRQLDVTLLHHFILADILNIREDALRSESNISYVREIEDALESVDKGRAQLAFLLNPTKPDSVRDVAYAGERMPQKSTDFYPKLMTNLLLTRLI